MSSYKVMIFFLVLGIAYVGIAEASVHDEEQVAQSSRQGRGDAVASESLDEWDPNAEIENLQRHIKNRVYNGLRRGFSSGHFDEFGMDTSYFHMSTDILENSNEYVVQVEFPGMTKEEIELTIKEERLIIRGERERAIEYETENADEVYKVYKSERRFGSLQRSIPLPENILEDKISAQYTNGVLIITLPKAPVPEEKEKKITIL